MLLTLVAIFFAKIAHMSLCTLRIIYLTRGKSLIAGAFGFFEVIIYLIALGMVITNLDQWSNILVYGFGFAAGNVIGSLIEEKIAIGIVHVQVITLLNGGELEEELRAKGYGVTTMPCYGKEGAHRILQMIMKRRELPAFLNTMKKLDHNAFISVFESRKVMGGYLSGMKAK